jgi:hypothetical protein
MAEKIATISGSNILVSFRQIGKNPDNPSREEFASSLTASNRIELLREDGELT